MKKLLALLFVTLIAQSTFAEQPTRIGTVESIPMGDGTTTFRDAESQVFLQGEQRLIVDERSYIVAKFDNGLPSGSWELFRNNLIREKLNYSAGRLDGTQIYYFGDGVTVNRKFEVVAGELNGMMMEYFQDGKVYKETSYKAGKQDGIDRLYSQTGELLWDCFYVANKPHGKQSQKYTGDAGDFTQVSFYENGVLTGKYTETWSNGTVRKEGEYDKAGKKSGRWIVRDKFGKIERDNTYKNNAYDGVTKTYFTDGTVEKTINYVQGNKSGVTTEYFFGAGSVVKSETTFAEGVQHGPYKIFYDTGKLREEGRAENDIVVYSKEFYPNGRLKAINERQNGTMTTIEKYSEDGTKQ